MDGRAFLDSVRLLMATPTEANRRSAVSRAYYAVLNEARSALDRWGFPVPAKADIDDFVAARFMTARSMDLIRVADCLDLLDKNSDKADNSLTEPGVFADGNEVVRLVQRAEIGIDLLDQIEADPKRLEAAITAIRADLPPVLGK